MDELLECACELNEVEIRCQVMASSINVPAEGLLAWNWGGSSLGVAAAAEETTPTEVRNRTSENFQEPECEDMQ